MAQIKEISPKRDPNKQSRANEILADNLAKPRSRQTELGTQQHGIDISERRLDDLDKQILQFALTYKAGDKVAIDLGCGFGRVSIMLALIGFEVWAYDTRDLHEHFAKASSALGIEGKLKFFQRDIAEITEADLPKRYGVAIAQRVLHHLPFTNAKKLMEIVASKLSKEGRIYASFTGIGSEIAKSYKCKQDKIENRYCNVSGENKEKFQISEKVCLYGKTDVKKLFANIALQKGGLYVSGFGNIKTVYYNANKKNYKFKKLLWDLFQS